LEHRTLMAVVPPPAVVSDTNGVPIRENVSNPNGADELAILNTDLTANETSPSIAVSPNNPNKLIAVWTRTDLGLPLPFTAISQAAFSTDSGRSWQSFDLPKPVFSPLSGRILPNPANPADPANDILRLPRSLDASVAIDRDDNVYIVSTQDDAGTTDDTEAVAGAIVLQKFSFKGNTPAPITLDKIIYAWDEDIATAIKPTLTVDSSVVNYTDTNTGDVQQDPYSGNIYIAWTTIDAQIKLVASSDGGNSFSARRGVSDFVPDDPNTGGGGGANFGAALHTSPRLTVSQGTADGRVAGGQVTAVWDEFGTAAPQSVIKSDSFVGAVSQSFSAQAGVIQDAFPGPNPVGPRTNSYPIRVNISDQRFTTVSDIDLRLSLLHPASEELTVTLIAPDGKRLPLFNGLNSDVGSFGIGGGGVNFGTTFDQEATLGIAGADAPFIGHFKPAFQPPPAPNQPDLTFNLSDYYGATPTPTVTTLGVNGVWTVEIIDNSVGAFDPTDPPRLVDAALIVTSGADPGTNLNGQAGDDVVVTSTNVGGLLEGPYPLAGTLLAASFERGINSGATIASDNTLGSFRSEHQGRIYVALTDFYNFQLSLTGTTNTDIFLVFSDDGGQTWVRQGATGQNPKGLPVNDDIDSRVDGFTTSLLDVTTNTAIGRPQFAPELAVDQTTGALAVSFYDARHDAQELRVARTVTTSIDGGGTFSNQLYSFANEPNAPLDVIERQNVVLGPIPDNISEGLPDGTPTLRLDADTDYGFGDRQGMVFTQGRIFTAWSGNANGGPQGVSTLDIRVAQLATTAGPRVIRSTMGQVSTTDSTGTPQAEGFFLEFDREVDINTFTNVDVSVNYRRPSSTVDEPVAVGQPVAQSPSGPGGIRATRFFVPFQTPQIAVGTYSYKIGAEIRDFGSSSFTTITPHTTNTITAGTATQYTARAGAIPIPDGNPAGATATINVTNVPADITIADLNVRVSITHPHAAQLRIELQPPTGAPILLSDGNGGGGANYTATVFDDQAATSIAAATAPFTGSFRPQDLLSAVNGTSPNGIWTLKVIDSNGAIIDNGTIGEFALTIATGATYGALGLDTVDGGKATATLGVLSIPANDILDDVTATLAVTHGNVASLTATLIDPAGIRTSIPTANLNGVPFSLTSIGLTTTQIRALTGNGAWRFEVIDPVGGGTGQITDFELKFSTERTYTSTDTPVSVSPNSTASALIPITLPPTILIDDVNVLVSASHFNARDLILTLVKQDINGVEVGRILLSNRNGSGNTGNPNGSAYFNTLFDQQAGTLITDGAVPFTGSFRPQGDLSTLNGLAGAGNWFLEVQNKSLSRTGTINSFQITLQSSSITGRADDDPSTVPVTGTPIPDRGLGVATSVVSTNPGGGVITDLNVNVSIKHDHPQDLDLYLVSPGGKRVALALGQGTIADAYTSTVFDDEAANPVVGAVGSLTGSFRPQAALSAFDGDNANGTWALEALDRITGQPVGTITDFNLIIATRTTISTAATVPVPDNSTRTSPLNVSSLPFGSRITDVNVTFNIPHLNVGDLIIDLISPEGTVVNLATNLGGQGDNFINTTLDDQGLTGNPPVLAPLITAGTAPFTGIFRTATGNALAAFNGEQGNGTWRLRVQDNAGNNISGSIGAWSLNIETSLAYGETPMANPVVTTLGTVSTNATVPIPDTNTPVSSPINVTSFPDGSFVRDANVTINITHANVGDLVIDLISPKGTVVNLSNHRGGAAANYVTTKFDEQAQTGAPPVPVPFISTGTAPFTATFRTDARELNGIGLDAFNGELANGTWRLRVTDSVGNAIAGSIGAWSLDLDTYVINSAATVVDVTGLPNTAITDIEVQVSIDHPSPQDLTLLLVAPDGTTALLASGQGGITPNAYTNTIFDDQAAQDIFGQTGSLTGTFRPEDSFIDFIGKNPNGRWKLLVADQTNTDPAAPPSPPATPAVIREFALTFRSETSYATLPSQAPVPDPGVVLVPLTVTGINATDVLSDIDVTVSVDHPKPADLTFTLVSPNGVRVELTSNNPAPAVNGANYTNTIFDDQATLGINQVPPLPALPPAPPFTGRFRPEQSLSVLNGLSGTILNGTWYLEVRDSTGTNVGSVKDFSLGIRTTPTFAPTTPVLPTPVPDNGDVTLDILVSGLPNGDLTADVDLYFSITHPDVSKLQIFLEAPDGTRVELIDPTPVAPITPLTGQNFTNTVLDDQAAAIITGAGPFTGRFRPMAPLSTLNGRGANGTWKLIVRDTASDGRTGSITDVRLAILTETTASALPLPIRELTTVSSAVLVNNFPTNEVITDVKVNVSLAHPSADGVSLFLIAPNGTRIELSSGNGGRTANGTPRPNYTNTTFDSSSSLLPLITNSTAPFSGSFQPEQSLAQLNGLLADGIWRLEVSDDRLQFPNPFPLQPGLDGEGLLTAFSLTITTGIRQTTINDAGNAMDQNANATPGESTDAYATPSPTDSLSFPLIVSGPHVVSTFVENVTDTIDNLVTDRTVSNIVVVFDRDMRPDTFTPIDVLRLEGPGGVISGNPTTGAPFTVTPIIDARHFRIGFPTQQLSGTYTIVIGSDIESVADSQPNVPGGDKMDANQNAGLDFLRGTANTGTSRVTSVNPTDLSIPVGGIVESTLDLSNNVDYQFLLQDLNVRINIAFPSAPNLRVELVADKIVADNLGTGELLSVLLVDRIGQTGTRADFFDTVFNDQAVTPIQNGGPPFQGEYNPQVGLGGATLSDLNDFLAARPWHLRITNFSNSPVDFGILNEWELIFQKPLPFSGLGESVADRTTASFRIFTMDPTNPISSSTWTAVGPAGVSSPDRAGAALNAEVAGRVNDLAIDPSDPSGNTVYAASASGGLWKTTNFLTQDATGPIWIPLLDNAPLNGMTIGGITLVAVNNDPNQTRVFVATGDGSALGDPERPSGTTSRGIGFLRSLDGGATWELLDSTNNALPFAQRNHFFALGNGTTSFRIVSDPKLTPGGQAILYAALSDLAADGSISFSNTRGGLWRSLDSGTTWTRLRAGQATDIVLDPLSGTGAPDGSLQFLYAAFRDQGVFFSNNRGDDLLDLPGSTGKPLIQNIDFAQPQPAQGVTPFTNGATRFSPNTSGSTGRIQFAKPTPTGDPLKDQQYQGWLYVSVQNFIGDQVEDFPPPLPNNSLFSLFMTKDFGQNWTRILATDVGIPSNFYDPTDVQLLTPQVDPTGGGTPGGGTPYFWGNFSSAIAVDPNDPNVLYFGGANVFGGNSLVRIDTTGIADPHAFYLSNDDPNQNLTEGTLRTHAGYDDSTFTGAHLALDEAGSPITLFAPLPFAQPPFTGPYYAPTNLGDPNFNVQGFDPIRTPFLNLIRNPDEPFNAGATVLVHGIGRFNNSGTKVRWTPFDQAGQPDPFDTSSGSVPGQNTWSKSTRGYQRIIPVRDPLTGATRLYFANDNGVYTAVDQGDGSLVGSIGDVVDPSNKNGDVDIINGSRNGNLQIAQFRAGASQTTALSAQLAVLRGMFMGNGEEIGQPISDANVIEVGAAGYGNLQWVTPHDRDSGYGVATQQNFNVVTVGGNQRPSVGATNVYQFETPAGLVAPDFVGDGFHPATDFFQVNDVSRTFGLVQTQNQGNVPDNQWPFRSEFSFAVNPINGNQIVIGSDAGRIFRTETAGTVWSEIARPGQDVDGSLATALAYGAPEKQDPTNLGDFIYVGTENGNVFFTLKGGAPWIRVSNGLDGSPIRSIVTNPTRGSHDAYAITDNGAFYNPNVTANGSTWQEITGNLFDLLRNPLGQTGLSEKRLQALTSLAVDYRYAIPNDFANPAAGTHPILYVAGDSGVFRTLDNGQNWAPFPATTPGSLDVTPIPPGDGGGLPAAVITDLDLVLGAIDPTNGRPQGVTNAVEGNAISPNVLLATTYGRGAFAIRLSPVTLPNSLRLSPTIPAPNGSDSGASNTDLVTNVLRPAITGYSQQTAFGNVVQVKLYDLTSDPTNRVVIGTGFTDETGLFSVRINAGVFLDDNTESTKLIGVQAFDQAGTPGNIALFSFILDTKEPLPPIQPDLQVVSDTGASSTDNVTSANTLFFDIAGVEPGATVQLFRSDNPGVAIATGFSAAGGIVTLTTTRPAQDGAYVYTAVQTDIAGNVGTPSPGLTVIFPDTPANNPDIPNLVDASDSGPSDTDNYTSDNTPTFDIQADPMNPGQTIQLRRQRVGSPTSVLVNTIVGSGQITDGPTAVADGVYQYFTVRGTTTSSPLIVTIDTVAATPATPDLQAGSDNGASNTDNTTSVSSPIFDLSVIEPNATLNLYRYLQPTGGTAVLVRSINAGAGGIVAVQDLGPLLDGDYYYAAEQIDLAGNTSAQSTRLKITIVNSLATPPNAPDLIAASDLGRFNNDNVTQATINLLPRFDITFNTSLSPVIIELVRKANGAPDTDYQVVNSISTTGTTTSPVRLSDPGPVFSDGVFQYASRYRYGATSFSAFSPALTVTIDNTLPGLSGAPDLVAASDTGTSNTDNITADNTPTFTVTGVAFDTAVRLLRDGVVVTELITGLDPNPNDGITTTTVTLTTDAAQPDGTFLFRTVQIDRAGNIGPLGPTLQVIIDTIGSGTSPNAPDLIATSDTGTSQTDNITADANPTFNVSVPVVLSNQIIQLLRKAKGAPDSSYVVVAPDRIGAGSLRDLGGGTPATPIAVPSGIYEYASRSVDAAGNFGVLSASLEVEIDTIAPVTPTDVDLQAISDTGSSQTDNITNANSLSFTISGVTAGAFVELYRDDSPTTPVDRKLVAANGTIDLADIGPVPVGKRTYTARQVDIAGNTSALSLPLDVTVNRTPPPTPPIPDLDASSDTGASNDDNRTNATDLLLRITGVVGGSTARLFRDGVQIGTLPGDGTFNVPTPNEGTFRFTVRLVDTAGNLSASSPELVVTVDRTAPGAPPAPDLQPTSDTGGSNSDDLTSDTSPTFDVTSVEADATVELLRDNVPVATRVGAGSITDPGPASDGQHAYALRQADLAGNPGAAGPALIITVDSTLPNAPDAPDLVASSDTGVSNSDNLTNASTREFNLTGVAAGLTVQLLRGGVVVGQRVGPGLVADSTALPDGVYSYNARALSALGNAGTPGPALALTLDRTPPAAPTRPDLLSGSDSGPSAIDNVTSVKAPSFDLTGVDAGQIIQLLRDSVVVAQRVGAGSITDPGPATDGRTPPRRRRQRQRPKHRPGCHHRRHRACPHPRPLARRRYRRQGRQPYHQSPSSTDRYHRPRRIRRSHRRHRTLAGLRNRRRRWHLLHPAIRSTPRRNQQPPNPRQRPCRQRRQQPRPPLKDQSPRRRRLRWRRRHRSRRLWLRRLRQLRPIPHRPNQRP
jgi:subtilisin-like proprotein convertase family protein